MSSGMSAIISIPSIGSPASGSSPSAGISVGGAPVGVSVAGTSVGGASVGGASVGGASVGGCSVWGTSAGGASVGEFPSGASPFCSMPDAGASVDCGDGSSASPASGAAKITSASSKLSHLANRFIDPSSFIAVSQRAGVKNDLSIFHIMLKINTLS